MDIVNLPRGQRATNDVDCIHIAKAPGGGFDLTGSALVNCRDGSDAAESVALISGPTYESEEAAETAGVAWATEMCVPLLYVSRA